MATAAGGSSEQGYNLVALDSPPNRPPVFAPVPPTAGVAGTAYALQLSATDPDGDDISYSVSTDPAAGVQIDSAGNVTWTSPTTGTYWVTATATDDFTGTGGPLRSQVRFQLPIRALNHPPVVQPATGLTVEKGETFRFDVVAPDRPDNDPLTYSLSGLSGATIDPLGRVRWDTPTADVKAYTFSVTVTDPVGFDGHREFHGVRRSRRHEAHRIRGSVPERGGPRTGNLVPRHGGGCHRRGENRTLRHAG